MTRNDMHIHDQVTVQRARRSEQRIEGSERQAADELLTCKHAKASIPPMHSIGDECGQLTVAKRAGRGRDARRGWEPHAGKAADLPAPDQPSLAGGITVAALNHRSRGRGSSRPRRLEHG